MERQKEDLLQKYLSGEKLSASELSTLDEFVHEDNPSKGWRSWVFLQWHKAEQLPVDTSFDQLRLRIDKTQKQQSAKRRFRNWWSVAALLIPIVFVSVYLIKNPVVKNVEYITANGERLEVWLPDSSKVLLNVASKLKFDKRFGTKHRRIYLDGEATFHVKKNRTLPFKVINKGIETVALGTIFTVNTHQPDQLIATLSEGVIEVRDNMELCQRLKVGQQLSYDRLTKSVSIKQLGKENIEAVTNHNLLFQNDSFSEVCNKIKRYYNIEIDYNQLDFSDVRLTLNLHQDTSLPHLLKIMQRTIGFKYKKYPDKIELIKTDR